MKPLLHLLVVVVLGLGLAGCGNNNKKSGSGGSGNNTFQGQGGDLEAFDWEAVFSDSYGGSAIVLSFQNGTFTIAFSCWDGNDYAENSTSSYYTVNGSKLTTGPTKEITARSTNGNVECTMASAEEMTMEYTATNSKLTLGLEKGTAEFEAVK